MRGHVRLRSPDAKANQQNCILKVPPVYPNSPDYALAAEIRAEGGALPATVTAGYNVRTGEVAARACGGGRCAEDHVLEALGGNRAEVRFTEAIRPRTLNKVPVCLVCEVNYRRKVFPDDTLFLSVNFSYHRFLSSTMTAERYPEQIDCVWLAVDRDGKVAAFVTGGSGPIPANLLDVENSDISDVEGRIVQLVSDIWRAVVRAI